MVRLATYQVAPVAACWVTSLRAALLPAAAAAGITEQRTEQSPISTPPSHVATELESPPQGRHPLLLPWRRQTPRPSFSPLRSRSVSWNINRRYLINSRADRLLQLSLYLSLHLRSPHRLLGLLQPLCQWRSKTRMSCPEISRLTLMRFSPPVFCPRSLRASLAQQRTTSLTKGASLRSRRSQAWSYHPNTTHFSGASDVTRPMAFAKRKRPYGKTCDPADHLAK